MSKAGATLPLVQLTARPTGCMTVKPAHNRRCPIVRAPAPICLSGNGHWQTPQLGGISDFAYNSSLCCIEKAVSLEMSQLVGPAERNSLGCRRVAAPLSLVKQERCCALPTHQARMAIIQEYYLRPKANCRFTSYQSESEILQDSLLAFG